MNDKNDENKSTTQKIIGYYTRVQHKQWMKKILVDVKLHKTFPHRMALEQKVFPLQ